MLFRFVESCLPKRFSRKSWGTTREVYSGGRSTCCNELALTTLEESPSLARSEWQIRKKCDADKNKERERKLSLNSQPFTLWVFANEECDTLGSTKKFPRRLRRLGGVCGVASRNSDRSLLCEKKKKKKKESVLFASGCVSLKCSKFVMRTKRDHEKKCHSTSLISDEGRRIYISMYLTCLIQQISRVSCKL